MDFPDDWPKPCPPTDAGPCTDAIYRLTIDDPPAPTDFRSFYQLGRCGPSNCKGRGLSVFRAIEHALHCASLFPGSGWKFVAEGTVAHSDGVLSASDSNSNGHRTFWPALGISPNSLATKFSVVADV
jgi:hypothetical protein